MNYLDYYFGVWRKYAVFSGRARRAEYWYFILFSLIAYVILAVIDVFIRNVTQSNASILLALYDLAVLIPSLAVGARRLHDTGRSAWWLLIGLIPVAGTIVLMIFFLIDGQPGANRYGPNPKEI